MNVVPPDYILGIEPAWWLALPPASVIAFIAMAARLMQGSWLAPGAAWAGFWTAATWIPLVLAPKYPVSPTALWVIVSFVATIWVFSYGGLCAKCARFSSTNPSENFNRTRLMLLLCAAGFAGGIAATAMTLAEYGASWNVWIRPDRLVDVTRQISSDRYGGEITESFAVRIMFSFTYLGALAGGHAMAWRKRGSKIWLPLAPLAGALLYALLTTAKAGVLFSLIFWLSAFAAETIRRRQRAWHIGAKLLLRGAIGGGLVITLFITAMLLRYGFDHASDPGFLLEQLRNYNCAHLTVFSSWWDSSTRTTDPIGWGRISFFGQTALLGLSDRQQGVYQVILSDRYYVDSNICTLYRGLIADFTLPGALALCAVASYIAGLAYRTVLHGSRASWSIILLTAFYATLLSSHVVNMFGYSTLMLAFLGYSLFCNINTRLALISKPSQPRLATLSLHE